jgi:hypothetical protein
MPKGNNPISKPNKEDVARQNVQLQLVLEQTVREAKALSPVDEIGPHPGQLRDSIQLVRGDDGSFGIVAEDYYQYIASGHGTYSPNPFIEEALAANLDKLGEAWADALVDNIIKQLDQFQ